MSLQPPSPAWITFSEWELAIFKGILFHLRSVSHLDVSKSYSLPQINGSNLCRSLPFIKWKTKNPSQMPQRCLRERKRLMCQRVPPGLTLSFQRLLILCLLSQFLGCFYRHCPRVNLWGWEDRIILLIYMNSGQQKAPRPYTPAALSQSALILCMATQLRTVH